jgi:hypothetical protein
LLQAEKIVVSSTGWADFVFKKDYSLKPLSAVKSFIEKNGHLPDIPTEMEVNANGMNLGEIQVKLLQKIEELTLYTIQQQDLIDKLNIEVEKLKNEKQE